MKQCAPEVTCVADKTLHLRPAAGYVTLNQRHETGIDVISAVMMCEAMCTHQLGQCSLKFLLVNEAAVVSVHFLEGRTQQPLPVARPSLEGGCTRACRGVAVSSSIQARVQAAISSVCPCLLPAYDCSHCTTLLAHALQHGLPLL